MNRSIFEQAEDLMHKRMLEIVGEPPSSKLASSRPATAEVENRPRKPHSPRSVRHSPTRSSASINDRDRHYTTRDTQDGPWEPRYSAVQSNNRATDVRNSLQAFLSTESSPAYPDFDTQRS
jgi:hypothetical protein